MFSSRFFRRIFLPYLLLICAATSGVGIFAALRLRDSYLGSARQNLHNQAVLVSDVLASDLAAGRASQLEAEAARLGSKLGSSITIVQSDGSVIGDKEPDLAQSAGHHWPPELAQAEALGDGWDIRHSRTLDNDVLYYAHKLQTPDGNTHLVRLSVLLAPLDRQLAFLYVALGLVVLAAIAAGALLSFYVAHRSAAPVLEITEFASGLARGELNRRLDSSAVGEIGSLATALNTMADALGRLISQTAKDRAELLAMLESMSEGVIATDTRRRVVVANDRAGAMLSFDPAGAQGKALWEVVRHEAILKAAGEVLASGERRSFQVSPAAGQYLEVTACTYPSGTTPEGLILVAHDTTQSVRYQELRKEFVANVSHELRTPLTVIRGFTETLRDGAMKDPVAGPKFLATIERHVNQLTNLVSDLLELSRLESTPEIPRRVSFDVGAVVRRAGDLLLPAAQQKSQSLTLRIPGSLPRIAGNPDYVERAVSNLIDNAIKYSPEHGKIEVSVWRDNGSITVDVSDNGIGIPPQDLTRIFERFYRVDRSRSRDMGGTGLGLSIVKHVAQVHGGSIDVASSPGAGSRFRLKFPLPPEDLS